MDSDALKAEQALKLREQVGRRVQYFNRLVERMDQVRFKPTDPLYTAAMAARDASRSLWMQAHYASCKSGVGRPAKS